MKDFTWPVSCSGYLWETIWLSESTIVGLATLATGEGVRTYSPMNDEPDLFIKFAELEQTDEARLAFAAQYGHLTRDVSVLCSEEYGRQWEDVCRSAVKSVGDSCDSRYMLPSGPLGLRLLLDRLANPNGVNESTWFPTPVLPDPKGEPNHIWDDHTAEMRLAYADWVKLNRAKRTTTPSDAETQCWDLQDLRRRLESVLSMRLLFVFDPDTGLPSHAPTDLLSALWLQFAYAVSGAREYRPCAQCRKLFGRSVLTSESGRPRRTRRDKTYCTDKCRKDAAYALRKPRRQAEAVARSAAARTGSAPGPEAAGKLPRSRAK